jgi:hypothetical protein
MDNPGPPATEPDQHHEAISRVNTWRHRLAVRAETLRHELNALQPTGPDGRRQAALYDGAHQLLKSVIDESQTTSTGRPGTWPAGLRHWWTGSAYETAIQRIHAAEVEIVQISTPEQAAGRLPAVLARAESLLPRRDPRLHRALTAMDSSAYDRTTPQLVAELLKAAFEIEEERSVRSRNFRNRLVRAGGILLLILGTVLGLAAGSAGALPICGQPPGTGPGSCLDGGTEAGGLDVMLIMALGVLGAALPMAARLQHMGGSWNPYGLPFYQEIIKLPVGALTAVLGLILIGTDWLPIFQVPTDWHQVAAYAIGFGIAQLAFTRMIDKRAAKLLSASPDREESTQLEKVATVEDDA